MSIHRGWKLKSKIVRLLWRKLLIAEARLPAILHNVSADGSIVGTIGGGMVERKVIEESLQALQERKPRLFHGRMARNGVDAVGSDRGGCDVSVYQRPWYASTSVLIGAGHVNRAIAQSAALLGFILPLPSIAKA